MDYGSKLYTSKYPATFNITFIYNNGTCPL